MPPNSSRFLKLLRVCLYVNYRARFNFIECREITLVNDHDLSRSKSLTLRGVRQVASLIDYHHKNM